MKEISESAAAVRQFEEQAGPYAFVRFTTTRYGGVSQDEYASFNLGEFCGDEPECVSENRRLLCNALGVAPDRLFIPHQTHEDKIFDIDRDFLFEAPLCRSEKLEGYDALITNVPGVALGITTADCAPVVFYDPVRHVIAAAHAGWRGTARQIVTKVAGALVDRYKCNPQHIKATVFPCISGREYEVGEEVVLAMVKAGVKAPDVLDPYRLAQGGFYLDLAEANRRMLLRAGLLPENITLFSECTYTFANRFFSARRQGYACGRMLSGVVMKK